MPKYITIGSKDREEALSVTPNQAYELVKTGVWSLKTFEVWLDHVVSDAECNAIYHQDL